MTSREEARTPGAPSGFSSVVRLPHSWFILCTSRELGREPLARKLQGTPLVLFRAEDGKPAALVDRCPHRNVPLSMGRVVEGTLQCAYHGWRFDGGGQCRAIPGLLGEPEAKSRCATSHATREQEGFIWVYSTPGVEPTHEPYHFPLLDAHGYSTARRMLRARGSLHATLENTLDVPHTAYLHGGLFRTEEKRNEIEVVVRRGADRVEAEYIGEPRPPGLVARILSPSGGIVTHFDRFILPSIAQVEYRIGDENHFRADTACTPVSDFETKLHAVVSFRSRLPGHVIAPFVKPLALRVFQQDAVVLAQQTELIHRFGGEQFASTEIDVLGRHIWRLLRAAERGDASSPEEETELELVV
jgi:phenylpropionate dioxygenase-like ring-hydroxylating dioxygenase large terminal subunit